MLPLEGIRVLDLSQAIMGPLASGMLGDMGAEVIKLEPRYGDLMNGLRVSNKVSSPSDALTTASHLRCNRNKRSIAVDLKKEKGREILIKLVKLSDVFLLNFRSSVVERMRLDYQTISTYNPQIIYAWPTAYGLEGDDKDLPAFDLSGQSRSGLVKHNGPSNESPRPIATPACDHASALYLAYGIMVALFFRERTGIGQQVGTSLLASALSVQAQEMNYYLLSGQLPPKYPRGIGLVSGLYMIFKAKDDWLAITGVPDKRWPAFSKAMGIEHLNDNPKFASANARVDNRDELVTVLDQIFLTKSRDEWLKLFKEAGFGSVTRVNSYAEAAIDPQVVANGYICEINDPRRGPTKIVGIPVQLSKTPGKIRSSYPEVGEHTNDILLSLGYNWEEIGRLTSEEVVGFLAKD
ncbi:MAG: CoA transferase [Dehalococcoidia bacterium]|nr:CoA transferase [Dehalococcoidia bacterium]